MAASARERLANAGAIVVDSPAEVAARCSVVSVVVNTDDHVTEAMLAPDGILAGASAGTLVAVHSTIHLETRERMAARAAEDSVAVLDAAVTGGVDAAARGELAVLLGGDPAAVEMITPALAHYASMIVRAGDLCAGMAAKLAIMVASFDKLAATYEGLLLARRAGVDVTELANVIAHSEAQSGIHTFFLHARAGTIADTNDHSLAEVARHEAPKSQKDLHAALVLADAHGLDLPVTRAAHDEMPEVWNADT
jgi:3-hydroxyisobutyrate dehydrogenase